MKNGYRVAVIGSTGRGNYGHGLDTAFIGVDRAKLVAVADDNPDGLKQAGQRLRLDRLYADYRKLLEAERPDIVCIGPRWVTDRVAMVKAAAERGSHIYCEKPFAGTLAEADQMIAACDQAKVKLAIAHQWRTIPPVQKAIKDVRSGKYGRLLRVRVRPKDDSRGGGEELIVHGTHLFDMMIGFAGPPQWVTGHVTVDRRDVTRDDASEGTEPVGPIAGDSISAMFGFADGVRGFFDSTANLSPRGNETFDNLYGLQIECEKAALYLRQPGDVYVYPAPIVLPDLEKLVWEKVWIEDWHFTPEHLRRDIRRLWQRFGNNTLANDLIDSIEEGREPLTTGRNAHLLTEMVQGVYTSHLSSGQRLAIPLTNREHPLLAS
jgi:predicted dehydrogenase